MDGGWWMVKIGRNDPCSCGSGKKYKNCCMKDSINLSRARVDDILMENPNRIADANFIESVLKDVEDEIDYTEKQYHTVLEGDRKDFARARREWRNMTIGQVYYQASAWRNGIWEKYHHIFVIYNFPLI